MSHLVIHYRGDLSGPRAALSFASLCHSYMCACLFGDNSRSGYFLRCNRSVFISNNRQRRGEERRKKTKEGVNVQETLFQIQIPLGFHSGESLPWCLRRLTSHFRVGGGVGTGAGVHPLSPLCDPDSERCAEGVPMLAAAAAPKLAWWAVGLQEKRRCCVPSAWAAECAGSGVGCSLTPCGSLLLCHRRGRRSRAEPSPGLDYAERTVLLQPRLLGWRLLRPKGEWRCLCVSASELGGETEFTWCGSRWSLGLTGQRSFLAPRFPAPPRAGRRSLPGRRSPVLASPTPTSALARGKKKSRTALLSPAKSEK